MSLRAATRASNCHSSTHAASTPQIRQAHSQSDSRFSSCLLVPGEVRSNFSSCATCPRRSSKLTLLDPRTSTTRRVRARRVRHRAQPRLHQSCANRRPLRVHVDGSRSRDRGTLWGPSTSRAAHPSPPETPPNAPPIRRTILLCRLKLRASPRIPAHAGTTKSYAHAPPTPPTSCDTPTRRGVERPAALGL